MSYIYTYKYWTLNNQIGYGGALPPNYDQVVQLLPEPVGLERIDKIGDRDGESFLGVYATGISELQFDDLTDLTISEFNGTSTRSISGNSVILDDTLTFSSLVFSDGSIYSLESAHNNEIIGTQTCTIVGAPVIAKSIDYKSWRNLLGYNEATEYDIITLRKEISDIESEERTFTNLEIANNNEATWLGVYTGYVVSWVDKSGYLNNITQSVASSQPYWDTVNKAVIGDEGKMLLNSPISFNDTESISLKIDLKNVISGSKYFVTNNDKFGIRFNGTSLQMYTGSPYIPISYLADQNKQYTTLTINRKSDQSVDWYCDNVKIGNTPIADGEFYFSAFFNFNSTGNEFVDGIYDILIKKENMTLDEIECYYNNTCTEINNIVFHATTIN